MSIDLLNLRGAARTPLILQAEAAECGLACLAMVAGYHGLRIDMPTLRRRFSVSLKGITLKGLMGIGDQVGFDMRPLRGEIDEVEELLLPAILHWDLNHFVVLTKVARGPQGRRFHIHDPARGRRILRSKELSEHFTGVALELTPSERFQARTQISALRISQLWSKLTGFWGTLRNVLLLSIVLQLVALAMPFYLQLAVDTAFPSFDKDLLLMLALGFGGLMAISVLTSWLRALILVSLSSSLSYQIVLNLNRHMLRLPLSWFEKRHVGDVISRFGSTQSISQLLSQGLVSAIIDGLMAFLTLGLMFVYSPLLAGVAFITWTLFAALKLGFLHAMRMRNIDSITRAAKENSAFIESVRGIAAIKAFGQEANRHRIWRDLKADAVNAQIRLGRLTAAFDALGQVILTIERVLFVYIAIRMAMSGAFTIGMIFAFQAYKQQFLDAGTRLVEQGINYKLLDVHLNRIADIALSPPEGALAERSLEGTRVEGSIEVRNLMFRYGAGEAEALKYVSLKIEPGEFVALVGPSGGGKTTLLKVMMGLLEPSYGEVLVDGRPMRSWPQESLRGNVGSVAQEDRLFAGTLAENIAFFDPEIDMEQVVNVAKLSAIHDEIDVMPMRYDTLVGDMGSTLSGGQRQRILLARALYGNPRIVFIDEGTAHLDPITEDKILRTLSRLGITRVIVAHSVHASAQADRIIEVAQGAARELPKGAAPLSIMAAEA